MRTTDFSNSSPAGFLFLIILLIWLSTYAQAQIQSAITIEPHNAAAYGEPTLIFDPEPASPESIYSFRS